MTGKRRNGGRRIHGLPVAEDVERELEAHLELRAAELVDAGWETGAAETEARRLFGDLNAIRSECRETVQRHRRSKRRVTMLSELLQDVKYAFRTLMKAPGFALVAILTLAMGIGANTAAFSIVNGVLLSPLPYAEPEQLVSIYEVNERGVEIAVAYPNYEDWRAQSRSFTGLAAYMDWSETVLGGREAVRANIAVVSRDFFEVMSARPVLGRTFVAEELTVGGRPAVLVSNAFWHQQLGARPLGDLTLQLAGYSADVVGVLPAGFDYPSATEIWAPAELLPMDWRQSRSAHNYSVVARLRQGRSASTAASELTALMTEIEQRDPENDARAVAVRELREDQVAETRRPLVVLIGASCLVLLVACTNLASALFARAAARDRELAVRVSLGANRFRLVRQLLTESMILAGFGAVIGIALAFLVMRGLQTLGPNALPRLEDVTIDNAVLGFTLLVTLATAIMFGIAPALRASATRPGNVLRGGSRSSRGPETRRTWSLLIGVEVALSVVLLVGAGLLIRSFWNIVRTDPGFDSGRIVTVPIELPAFKYESGEALTAYYDRALDALRRLPGVHSAAAITSLPLVDSDPGGSFAIEGGVVANGAQASYRVVSPDFFSAMKIPVVSGRSFNATDREGSLPVMLINRTMAEQFFPGQNPIGRRVKTLGMDLHGDVWVTIVGIVGDVRHRSLMSPAAPAYYLPHSQRPDRIAYANLVIRAQRDEHALMESVRATLRRIDADVPIETYALTTRIGESVADRRLIATVLAAFAGIALVLAGVGIYGVVASAVAQRTREIGIRMAIGARATTVLWTVSRNALGALVLGITVGIIASALLSRVTGSLLHGIDPIDPITFVVVIVTLLGVGVFAATVPATRALRINPILTLRSD